MPEPVIKAISLAYLIGYAKSGLPFMPDYLQEEVRAQKDERTILFSNPGLPFNSEWDKMSIRFHNSGTAKDFRLPALQPMAG